VSEPALTHLQNQLYRDFVKSFQRLQDNLVPRQIGLADVPPELRAKFVSDTGRFLLQIHPAVDIWDRDGARRFVSDLRATDPDVTGTPIITFEALRLMERAYQQGTIYAIVLVTLATALTLRRFRETVLALLPLGLGLMWAFGLMYFFNLQFNMGNVFGSADPGRRRGVRPERRDALPGGPRSRRPADRALDDDGGAGQRPHDHLRVRQPDDRRSSRIFGLACCSRSAPRPASSRRSSCFPCC